MIFVADGFGALAAILAILMFKVRPARFPKVASFFALIAGISFAVGWAGRLLQGFGNWLDGFAIPFLGISFGLAGMVITAYIFLNQMSFRLGRRFQGGQAGIGTAVCGFLAPLFVAMSTGPIARFFQGALTNLQTGVTQVMSGGG